MNLKIINQFRESNKTMSLKDALYYCGFNLVKVKTPCDGETHKIKITNKKEIKDLQQLLTQANLDFNSLNFSYDLEHNYVYLTLKEVQK